MTATMIETAAEVPIAASQPKRQRFRSVSVRFSWALILVVALVMGLFAALGVYINYQRNSQALEENLRAYLSLTENALRVPVWNIDYDAAQGVIDGLLVDSNIVWAVVIADGAVAAVGTRDPRRSRHFANFSDKTLYASGSTTITHKGEVIGTLRMVLSRKTLRDRLRDSIIAVLVLLGLIMTSIAVTSFWLVRRFVARPLADLQQAASTIAGGHLDAPLSQSRNDEIGLLARDFDSMRSSVKTLFGELQTANQNLEQRVSERTSELSDANRKVMASVRYASRIQAGVLPAPEALTEVIPDHFLIWQPRDIVGGDFFWCHQSEAGRYVIVADCTGHGVPGAFMTLIASRLIDQQLRRGDPSPSALLKRLDAQLRRILNLEEKDNLSDDGMEVGVCFLPTRKTKRSKQKLIFAGARFSLFHAGANETVEIKGDKVGVGYRQMARDVEPQDVEISVGAKDCFYLITDGLIDQIGGPRRLSFGKRRLRAFLDEHKDQPMNAQAEALSQILAAYQGDEARRDDLTVLGFRCREDTVGSNDRGRG